MDSISLLALFAFLTVSYVAGSTGSFFRPGPWYEGLAKPRWRPPNWLFGPVWAVLYAMIAVAGWLVWREAGFAGAALPLTVFAVQLVLNAIWSYLFFGLRNLGLALAEMGTLWLSIVAMIVTFAPISGLAATLLVPYLLWVSFAWVLNLAIWRLNAPQPA